MAFGEIQSTTKPILLLNDDWLIYQKATTLRWHWIWVGGVLAASVKMEGFRGYSTKSNALRAAKASLKRLSLYIITNQVKGFSS